MCTENWSKEFWPDRERPLCAPLLQYRGTYDPGRGKGTPDINEAEHADTFRVVMLDALVRMKLVAFRDKDRKHLRDLIELGLVDESWLPRVPPELRSRLSQLLANPQG